MLTRKELQEKFNAYWETQDIVKQPELLYQPVKYTLDCGGKRIRPVLLLMVCDMFGIDVNQAIKPAMGLEIFHNFTLLHDDIMDKSNIRRGKPTVHAKWNENIAILSGDAMSIMASQYILETPRNLKKLLTAFYKASIDVCEGQQFDMDFEDKKIISEDEYLKMIALKTGALLAVSLQMGAIISDASDADIQHLYDFGMKMGLGFQLQDDWLDCFGDQDKFGKAIGKDILNEKKTYLFIKAYELANETQTQSLNRIFGNNELSPAEKIQSVLSIYNELKIGDIAIEKANAYFAEAQKSLDMVSCAKEKKAELRTFLDYLKGRSF